MKTSILILFLLIGDGFGFERREFPAGNIANQTTVLSAVWISPQSNGPDIRITSTGNGDRAQNKTWGVQINNGPCQVWNIMVAGETPTAWQVTTVARRINPNEVEFATSFEGVTVINTLVNSRTEIVWAPEGPMRYSLLATAPVTGGIVQQEQRVEEDNSQIGQ